MTGVHDYEGSADVGPDLTSLGPIHQCICGSTMFKIWARFEDFEIAMYSTEGECIECHARVRVPTPIDHPDHIDCDTEEGS